MNNLLSRVFLGYDLYRIPFVSLLTGRFVFIVLIVLFWQRVNPDLLFSFYFMSAFLQGVHLVISLKRLGINFRFRFDIAALRKIFSSSLIMGSGILFVWLYDRIDILLIEMILGSASTASYAIAYSLYKIPQLIAAVILVPLFTKLSINDLQANLFELIKQNINLILSLCIIVIPLYFLFSEQVITLLYGDKYSGTGIVLNTLVLALPGLLLNNLTGVALNSIKKEKVVMYATFQGLLLNLIINCTLLPMIGISAAILAVIITEYSVFIVQIVQLRKIWRKRSLSEVKTRH